jgi:hypothetical protein
MRTAVHPKHDGVDDGLLRLNAGGENAQGKKDKEQGKLFDFHGTNFI